MRIAIAYRFFELTGSLARETVDVSRHLARNHDVHVFSIGSRTDPSLAPGCTFHDVRVPHIARRRFSARELGPYALRAAALIRADRFDVVYACAPSTWVADVLHVPGVARDEATLQGVPRWRYLAQPLRRPGDGVRRALERKALRYPGLRRVHAAAPSVRESLHRHYGFVSQDVLVVPPAVNVDEVRPPASKATARASVGLADQDVLVLLFCGSDFARKGLDRAITSTAELDMRALLLVAGGGDEGPYRELAGALGIGDRVRFLGLRADAWRFYQAADVVLLPTRADVWGVTPLEAMACGVPPIVSAAAGSAAAIRDGETGIVLPEPFEQAQLTESITRLASQPSLREAMGRAGVVAAQEHCTTLRSERIEEDLIAVASGSVAMPRRRRRDR